MIAPLQPLAPGATQAVRPRCSPARRTKRCWKRVAPGLDLVKDYGIFTILAKPLYWLMDQLAWLASGNWGWSIMALVLVIKIAFYWLQARATRAWPR